MYMWRTERLAQRLDWKDLDEREKAIAEEGFIFRRWVGTTISLLSCLVGLLTILAILFVPPIIYSFVLREMKERGSDQTFWMSIFNVFFSLLYLAGIGVLASPLIKNIQEKTARELCHLLYSRLRKRLRKRLNEKDISPI